MFQQVSYTRENPPKTGVAKKIWMVLENSGCNPSELHYNGGRRGEAGGGTWACETEEHGETWCGLHGRTMVYLESSRAPYNNIIVGFTSRICPFYQRTKYYPPMIKESSENGGVIWKPSKPEFYMACKYPSLKKNVEMPTKCPKDCQNCTDEFLTIRNNEYAKMVKTNG